MSGYNELERKRAAREHGPVKSVPQLRLCGPIRPAGPLIPLDTKLLVTSKVFLLLSESATVAYSVVLRQSSAPPRRGYRMSMQRRGLHLAGLGSYFCRSPACAGLSQGPFTSIQAAHDNSVQAVLVYMCVGECIRPLSPCCRVTAENDVQIVQVSGPRKRSSTSSGPHRVPG